MRSPQTDLLTTAQHHYQTGQLAKAEALYCQALQQPQPLPQTLEALSWLALIVDQLGRPLESMAYYEQILALNPQSAEAHSNLGSLLCQQGRLADAISHHQKALDLRPQSADAHYNLGVVLYEAGQLTAAIDHYRQVLQLNPDYANAHNNLGVALSHLGDRSAAIVHYRQAVKLNPNHANAHNNLGVALYQDRQIEAAIDHYRQAVAIKPDYFNVYDNLGTALREQGKLADAIASYQQAIALAPNYAPAYDNLGTVFQDQGNFESAIAHYRQAIAIDPNYANAYNNLASALKETGNLAAAITSCREAIRLQPDHADAHNNYGSVLVEQGEFESAIAHFEIAIRHKPQLANAHLNLGIVLLLLGNFQRGWTEYHWRWQTKQCPSLRYPQAFWDGSDLGDRIILLTAEQGFGDTIQFARYAPLVAQRGGQVVLACPKPLLRLLETLPGTQHCVDRDRVNVQTHVHIPLLDLPMILGTTLDSIPANVPYLTASPLGFSLPQPAAPANPCLKVGFVWASNPANSTAAKRSCSLSQFLSLQALPGIELYSLQKDSLDVDRALLQTHSVIDLSERLHDFADTAAAIVQLDLVISVDTAVAHLAGALGKPVWTLLPAVPDWRWMTARDDTPWYPTMRLFRQPEVGDWEAVFAQIAAALRSELSQPQPLSRYHLPPTPDAAETHLQLGMACYKQQQFAAAIAHYHEALALQPNLAEVHNNLGVAYCQQGPIETAIQHYQQAIHLKPDYADAHLNLGIAQLLLGDLRSGFTEYHWRWQTHRTQLAFPEALWDGTDLSGKTILLTAEQGFGDTLQFIRYVPLVAQFHGRIIVACQPELRSLLAGLPGIERCIDRDTETAEIHVHAPLLELPRILGTTLDTIPAAIPYLAVPATPSRRLPTSPHRLHVGIVWATHSTSATAVQRSCPLSELMPLFNLPGIAFYSLQKQPTAAERQLLQGHHILDLQAELHDFADTAAAIAQLDLVISIDSAVAHLAGALGKPVWTLLPAAPDWRWLLTRTDSPWYPTMRLFRQPQLGDWTTPIAQLATALTRLQSTLPAAVASCPLAPAPSLPINRLKPCRHGTFLYSRADEMGRSLEQFGDWGEAELTLLQPWIRVGDWVVEVGAGSGAQTVFFAKAVGETGRVIALESDRLRFQMLCANLALNNLLNTDAYQTATHAATARLAVPDLMHQIDQLALPQCRLLKLNPVNQIQDLLPILQGAHQTIAQFQPLLYCPIAPLVSAAVLDFLEQNHYEIYQHGGSPLPPGELDQNVAINLVAVPAGQPLEIHGLKRLDRATDRWQLHRP